MVIRDGKFYESELLDKHVPIEFGNWAQIKLLERIQTLTSGDGEVVVLLEHADDHKYNGVHACVCGHRNSYVYTDDELDESFSKRYKCGGCKLKYRITVCDFSEFYLLAKIVK